MSNFVGYFVLDSFLRNVSTQTEPLPPDFQFEDMMHDETDKIIAPLASRKRDTQKSTVIYIPPTMNIRDEMVLDTPKEHAEETITHGQLLVEPINGAQIFSEPDMSHERNISITNDECEISKVSEFPDNLSEPMVHSEGDTKPENFLDGQEEFDEKFNEDLEVNKFDQGSANVETNTETPNWQLQKQNTHDIKTMRINLEEPQRPTTLLQNNECPEVMKIQKQLDVTNLDVERLIVKELIASKIIVSEIESSNESTDKLSSKSGNLSLESQPNAVRKLLEKWEDSSVEQQSKRGERKLDVDKEDENVLETSCVQNSSIIPISLVDAYVDSKSSQYSAINNDILIEPKPMLPISENSNDFFSFFNEHCGKLSQNRLEFGENIWNSEAILVHNSDTTKQLVLFDYLPKEVPKEEVSDQEMQNTNYEVIEQSHQEKMWNSDNFFETSRNNGGEYERNFLLLSEFEETSDKKQTPARPPRSLEKRPIFSETSSAGDEMQYLESRNFIKKKTEVNEKTERSCHCSQFQLIEPYNDDELIPKPPHSYVFPVSSNELYTIRKQCNVEDLHGESPLVSNRKHRHRTSTLSESSSSESSSVRISRRKIGYSELSIPQLSYQLIRACSVVARHKLNSLIHEISSKLSNDFDADNNKQIVQLFIVVLLFVIAVLLFMGDRKTIHLHHWEYFSPPTNS